MHSVFFKIPYKIFSAVSAWALPKSSWRKVVMQGDKIYAFSKAKMINKSPCDGWTGIQKNQRTFLQLTLHAVWNNLRFRIPAPKRYSILYVLPIQWNSKKIKIPGQNNTENAIISQKKPTPFDFQTPSENLQSTFCLGAELINMKLQKVRLLSYIAQSQTLRLFKLMWKTLALK